MKIYIAGPLFNEMELERNRRIRDFIEALGHETYLPQEDGGVSYDLISEGADTAQTRQDLFARDIAEIESADAVLCLLDGRTQDEGMCVELGMGYALGKTRIGYHTDQRTLDAYGLSLMVEGCLAAVAHSEEELRAALESALG